MGGYLLRNEDYFGEKVSAFSPWSVSDLSKTAVEKFGKDPEFFVESLKIIREAKYNAIRKLLYLDADGYTARYVAFEGEQREIFIYRAIRAVDLEVPGFIDNFPTLEDKVWCEPNRYELEQRDKRFSKSYNRYSGNHDKKWLTRKIGYKDDGRHDSIRFDDYVALHFLELLEGTKSPKFKRYLFDNYTYPETLLPKDYLWLMERLEYKLEDNLDPDDTKNIDRYFYSIDEIRKDLDKKINKLWPRCMRMINSTLLI